MTGGAAVVAFALGLVAVTAAAEPAAVAPIPRLQPPPDLLLQRIDAAIAAGLLDVARELIARGEATVPPAQLALAQADYDLASGATEKAEAGYSLLTADPAVSAGAQLGLGLARLRTGDTAGAVTALDAALAANPSSVRGWVARGVAADRNRDWSRAETCYGRALALDPRSATAYLNRGYSQLLRGRFAEAVTDSNQALVLDPKLDTARTNLRLAQAMQGDYKNAFKGSTKATLAHDLNTVGFAAMARGDYGVAETFFTRAMQTNPQFDRIAWDNLVYLKQLAHKPVEPQADLEVTGLALADVPAVLALGLVLAAAASDLARFEIPDWLSVAVLALAAVYGLLTPGYLWWSHLAAPCAMFAFGLLAFSRGWLGGGDVKLMTALAGWSGLFQLPVLFLAISIAGGVLALVLAVARSGLAASGRAAPRLFVRGEPLPYAVAIAAGTIWWVWATGAPAAIA